MDFLDPKQLKSHRIRLYIGYGLVAIAIALLLVIFLFQAYGYNYHKGEVVRDGLVFVSSHPNNAKLKVDGQTRGSTSKRLQLQAGKYHLQLSRSGYQDWRRTISVQGGKIERFEYPMLFPKQLNSTSVRYFNTIPEFASESPDNHYLLVQLPTNIQYFQLYNLSHSSPLEPTNIKLPSSVLTSYSGRQRMIVESWSKDGDHVLLKHQYGKNYEYILLDTSNPSQSINLNAALGLTPSDIRLYNDFYDQYYLYNKKTATVRLGSLGNQKTKPLLKNVVQFVAKKDNILYQVATNQGGAIKYYDGSKSYTIMNTETGHDYAISLEESSSDWYVVVADKQSDRVYFYKNPLSSISSPKTLPHVTSVMRIRRPVYVKASPEHGYILVESGSHVGVYDVALAKSYMYDLKSPLDKPQKHVTWMREGLVAYVSHGRLIVSDFDGTNLHKLVAASPDFAPFFDINYKYLYTLSAGSSSNSSLRLVQTPLLTKADL